MGALGGEYRCPVTDIRPATADDFDAVFDLLDARSRAAFGTSQQDRAHLRQHWEVPGGGRWVAVADRTIVGYVALDEGQEIAHAAVDPDVADALFAHAEREARDRGFDHVAVA